MLLITVRGITDAQAVRRTTVSGLSLGGIIKHISRGEQVWTQIMVRGTESHRKACWTWGSTSWPTTKRLQRC